VWARVWGTHWRPVPWLLVAALLLLTARDLRQGLEKPKDDWRWHWSWQRASDDLISEGARRLIFTWDNPTSAIADPGLHARVASFFFARRGIAMPTRFLNLHERGKVDPNTLLLSAADRPKDAIIWAYDRNVRGTLANFYPPRISQIDPRWACRDYGGGNVSIISCIRPS
jgi:hypothetical protein